MEGRAPPPWQTISDALSTACGSGGLDLVHPFQVCWFNDVVGARELRLPDFGDGRRLGVLIGNTSVLWEHFLSALWRRTELQDDPDPLDRYCTEVIDRALHGTRALLWHRLGHVLEPAPPLPIQRIAHAAGLAHLSPSHLSLHPRYGSWLALRAVAIFDVAGPEERPPPAADPCSGCAQPCIPALTHAVKMANEPSSDHQARWQAWLSVRDVCPVARGARYSEDQIHFHYAKLAHLSRRKP